MPFVKKTWKDRQSEHPNRRILTPTGNANEYDVERNEGLVLDEGVPYNQATMNDLETRISNAVAGAESTASAAMPKAGGNFSGKVVAQHANVNDWAVRNIYFTDVNGNGVSSCRLRTYRK